MNGGQARDAGLRALGCRFEGREGENLRGLYLGWPAQCCGVCLEAAGPVLLSGPHLALRGRQARQGGVGIRGADL